MSLSAPTHSQGLTPSARSTVRMSRHTLVRRVVLYTISILTGIMFTVPFLWTLSSALKTPYEILQYPPPLFPAVPQFGNFYEVWVLIEFGRFTQNSIIVTITSLIGAVSSSALVAYGFSRFRFFGRGFLFMLCLSAMMLPPQVTIIPLFVIFKNLGCINTFKPLIVPSFFGGGAFSIFLLRQFFMTLPLELDEAATIDGAGKLTIFTRILLPLSGPALSSAAIFCFIGNWNAFLEPLIFLNSRDRYTLPIGLSYLSAQPFDPGLPKDHLMMAAATMTTLPVLTIFFSAQRYFVRGIVTTGIKG